MNPKTLRMLSRLAFAAAPFLLVAGSVQAADYLDLRRAVPDHSGDVAAGQEKSMVCRACHGQEGNTPVPSFPNLGGQHAEYLYWGMMEYKLRMHIHSPMNEQLEPLSNQDLRDIAAFFASQPVGRNSTEAGDPALLGRGEAIFRHGDRARGVPPCQGCHGKEALGVEGQPGWPVLRGQHREYLAARLQAYRERTTPHTSNDYIMTGVAHRLDEGMIDALSTWLDSLSPQ